MRRRLAGLLLLLLLLTLLLPAPAGAHDAPDPKLLAEINAVRAVDNHGHVMAAAYMRPLDFADVPRGEAARVYARRARRGAVE